MRKENKGKDKIMKFEWQIIRRQKIEIYFLKSVSLSSVPSTKEHNF